MEWQKALLYIGIGAIFVLSCFLCFCAGDNNRSKDVERLEQQAAEYRATIAKLTDSITDLNSRLTQFTNEYNKLVDTISEVKEGSGRLTSDIQRAADINTDIIRSVRELQEASRNYIKETSGRIKSIPNKPHSRRRHSNN